MRAAFVAAYGDAYGEDVVYSDVAPGVRASIAETWGRQVDETDPVFTEAFRRADLTERRRYLVQQGLQRGVGTVTDDALSGLAEAVGGTVRRAA